MPSHSREQRIEIARGRNAMARSALNHSKPGIVCHCVGDTGRVGGGFVVSKGNDGCSGATVGEGAAGNVGVASLVAGATAFVIGRLAGSVAGGVVVPWLD